MLFGRDNLDAQIGIPVSQMPWIRHWASQIFLSFQSHHLI